MKRLIFFAPLFILLSFAAQAQSTNPWKFVPEKDITTTKGARATIPNHYKTPQLNIVALKAILDKAPAESFDGKKSNIKLTLPMPDGRFEEFYICESSVMHPDLAKQYPEIKSYLGNGVQNPASYLRFDLTPHGFHAIVLAADGNTIFVEPYSKEEKEFYLSYYSKDVIHNESLECITEGKLTDEIKTSARAGDCGVLRTYRLAMAATGEFTIFSGGTVPLALAAINTLVIYVNGVYEREHHLRLVLVPMNTAVIFTNPATDPYEGDPLDLNDENVTACNTAFTNSGYDIGFVVHQGSFHASASNNSVCNTNNKARGHVKGTDPLSYLFRVSLLHEFGHQFGATHTMNGISNCNAPAIPATSAETGVGSTIMGANLALGCTPGYQPYTDSYFHGINLPQMGTFILGHTCPMLIPNGNSAPTVDAGPDRTFPKSTKFILNATGTDDGNALTYCWEQIDLANATMPPVSTSTVGPSFRSYPPIGDPNRRFPKFYGGTSGWEVLPSVGRMLNFRVTARDNSPAGGCTIEDDVAITIDGNSGPFLVTSLEGPNIIVCPTDLLTVTWNVAGTNLAPVSCTNVDILLSTSSGAAYPIVLASNTPNDGIEVINLAQIPIGASPYCRVMVRSHWSGAAPTTNCFFDDSNSDFTIENGVIGFLNQSQTPAPMVNFVCTRTSHILRLVSPCGLPITMFPTTFPIPSYVTWSFVNNIFSFSFNQPGSFAVTFRVMTPTGFVDRIFVFYGNNCEGWLANYSDSEMIIGSENLAENVITNGDWENERMQEILPDDFVKLRPNPISSLNLLTIEIPNTQELSNIYLFDIKGNSLQEMETSESVITMDLSDYAPGMYFVKVASPFFSTTKKFIISE